MKNPNLPKGVREFQDCAPLYVEHIIGKARVSMRKTADRAAQRNNIVSKKSHWANHAGTYKDSVLMKVPKFWRGQKQILVSSPIREHKDLISAISSISSGDREYNHYPRVTGIDRERLRLAQSWRDRGIPYEPADIIQLNANQIKIELDFRV